MNKIQYERKPWVPNFIAQRRERRRVGQTLPRFSSQSGHSRQGGYREGRHLHLLCPQLAPSFSCTPRGHPGGAAQADGRGRANCTGGGSAETARAGQAASPGAAPGSRLRARPGPAWRRRRERGRQLTAASRPHTPLVAGSHPARCPPPPAMSAAAGCRQSRCRPGRRWLQSAAIILCSLRAAAMSWGSGGGSIFTAAPPAGGRPRARVSGASPSPLRPPRLSPAPASSSCSSYRWYKLLRHCFRSRPGSRWSFILSPT